MTGVVTGVVKDSDMQPELLFLSNVSEGFGSLGSCSAHIFMVFLFQVLASLV